MKEWNILKRIPELTGGADWNTMWTFGATPEETDLLHGVTISGGHVVSLALNGNNLSGRIPHIAFALDSLRSLNLAGNNLSGNIEMDYVDEDYDYQSVTLRADSLKLLDISGNQLTGDLYDVMTFAPNLTTLRANNNRISEISSPLPVYTLQYDGQDLRGIYSPTYSELFNLIGEPDEVVPSVLSYMNYDNSTESSNVDGYKNSIRIFLSEIWGENSEDYWYGSLSKYFKSNSTMSYYYSGSWCDGWYMAPTGRELVASIGLFSSSWDGRHRFSVVMDYEMGDVDFDTQVNVSDLQKTLNTAMDSTYYNRYNVFNFRAANVIATDAVINVQDVVAEINLLLDRDITPSLSKPRTADYAGDRQASDEDACEAVMYVKDGKLILRTSRPVAALDIALAGESAKWSPLMQMFSMANRGGRTIAYSLFGDEIPEGETVLADYDGEVASAMIVDIDGNEISLMIGDGEATAINGIKADDAAADGAVYDLQGRKVADRFNRNTLRQGIYIVKGKKTMIY